MFGADVVGGEEGQEWGGFGGGFDGGATVGFLAFNEADDGCDVHAGFAGCVDGEERFVQLGETDAGRVLVVVSTWRRTLIRVVTAFDAPKSMKLTYIAQRGSPHGTDPQSP